VVHDAVDPRGLLRSFTKPWSRTPSIAFRRDRADHDRARLAVTLVEGEFDAMLFAQELAGAGVPLAVASLGSASRGLPTGAIGYLLAAERVFVVYDSDDEGRRGAERLTGAWPCMRVDAVPGGHKDLTDAFRAGLRLGDYGAFLLARSAWQDDPTAPTAARSPASRSSAAGSPRASPGSWAVMTGSPPG
jgi:hypothetical protein